MRVFFALWPDDFLRQKLEKIQQPVAGGRKLAAVNFHLTLHFIGEVEHVDCLLEKASEILFHPLDFSIDHYGVFQQPRVLWAGPESWSEDLIALAADCRRVAADCGYPPRGERFRPHVTLARKIRELQDLPKFEAETWRYDSFYLVESVSTPTGVVYKKLGVFAAGET